MSNLCQNMSVSKNYPLTCINQEICGQKLNLYGSIFGKRDLLAIDHIMLALFWSYVPNRK